MAAQAEEPLATSSAPDPTPPLLPRPSPHANDDQEDKDDGSRDTKRRRTCLAALDSLETHKRTDCSFSFHARGGVAPIDTTPKFGSFNPVLLLQNTTTEKVSEETTEAVAVAEETVAVAEEKGKGKGKGKAEEQGAEEDASDSGSDSESKNEECSKTQTQ